MTKILIAGGGWRVQRFILPALELAGVSQDEITIFRKTTSKIGSFPSVEIITDLKQYEQSPHIVINCLPPNLLLDVGEVFLEQYSKAKQYWDTPSTASWPKLFEARRKQHLASVTSLEDFVLLPNILALRRAAGEKVTTHLHHFGIATHFLSVVRTSLRATDGWVNIVRRSGKKFVASNGSSMMRQKQLTHAALYSSGTNGRFVDNYSFASVARCAQNTSLSRVVKGGKIIYRVGENDMFTFDLSDRIMQDYVMLGTRQSVHELDKVLALYKIFTTDCESDNQYCFSDSIKDSIGYQMLNKCGFTLVRL